MQQEKRSWEEFHECGLLWWVNRMLHLFGWCIVLEQDSETGNITRVYPARCNYRGFPKDIEENGFTRLTEHLRDNANRLFRDVT